MARLRLIIASLVAVAAFAYPAHTQIPGGDELVINKTPIVGGTNGNCLYDNSGKVGEQTCGTGTAADIKVGTTTITSGTTTRVLYDNAGVLGEYTNTQLTALINAATASLPGALPAWPNNTTTFFRGDGTYATLNCAALGGVAASCATDATNASNIGSGTLPTGRLTGSYTGITGVGALAAGSLGAGFTTVPVAQGGTNYTGGAWTSFTYTVTAGTGTITTQTAGGTSFQIGKFTCLSISTAITNAGTGSGALTMVLPFAPVRQTTLVGRETGISGKVIAMTFNTTTGSILNYDSTNPTIALNATYVFDGCYEAS